MNDAHRWQRKGCEGAAAPILNAACKEDPAKLGGDYGAVNMDIWTFDEQTKLPLSKIPNFVQGDVLNMPDDWTGKYGTIVLGEFLEHCVPTAARDALLECKRVLKDDGRLIVTLPLDGRKAEAQHAKHLLKVIVKGETGHDITVWHQTVWEDDMLEELWKEVGLEVVLQEPINYGFILPKRQPEGWGFILKKA